MYEVNLEMKRIINELTSTSTPKEMIKAMKGKKDSLMVKSFGDLENNTVETPKESWKLSPLQGWNRGCRR